MLKQSKQIRFSTKCSNPSILPFYCSWRNWIRMDTTEIQELVYRRNGMNTLDELRNTQVPRVGLPDYLPLHVVRYEQRMGTIQRQECLWYWHPISVLGRTWNRQPTSCGSTFFAMSQIMAYQRLICPRLCTCPIIQDTIFSAHVSFFKPKAITC